MRRWLGQAAPRAFSSGVWQELGFSTEKLLQPEGWPCCAQAVPACPPPWNLPAGSSFRLEEGQSGSQQGQCLARIIVQGENSRLAGFLSCLAQESMEKQLQEGEVTVMKPYWRQVSVKTKGNLDVWDSSSAGGSFFSTEKSNAKLQRACFSLEPASPA